MKETKDTKEIMEVMPASEAAEAEEAAVETKAEVKSEPDVVEATTEVESVAEAAGAETTGSVEANASPDAEAAGSEAPAQENDGKYDVEGILELSDDGFGFLRFDNFLTSSKDIYVSPTQIRRFGLRTGDKIFGIARKPRGTEKFGALL